MSRFLLYHRHAPRECPAAFAAWKAFSSPLRRATAISSCLSGRHEIWWKVDAPSADDALAHLPAFVAKRTVVIKVSEVRVP
jgi:hypothetical protein